MRNGINLWRPGASRDWNPVMDLQRDIDRLFADFMRPISTDSEAQVYSPACDVEESGSHFVMSFDLPGVKKDDIRIEVRDNQLVVSGKRKSESNKEERGVRMLERTFGEFQRVFTLPTSVDVDRIEANYEDGVLRLAIPKAESAKPRQIKIGEGKTGFFSKLLGQGRDEKKDVDTTGKKVA